MTRAKIAAILAMARCWLCRKLCGSGFCNIAASREIDRLTIENERLRAEAHK